ncbi:MAG: hypothetical protein OSJ45_03910 [Lachnospiraceae bacterium]|nr:hypothetical protein [Lachnospiraceae bacterium]
MKKFKEKFECVALRYAEYVGAKLISSVNIIPPGQGTHFIEPKEAAEEYIKEIQILCQIAETLQNLNADVIGLDAKEIYNLQPTDAELEAFRTTTVCYIQEDEKTGALEITPAGNKEKIILADEGQIKSFLYVVGSFIKKDR